MKALFAMQTGLQNHFFSSDDLLELSRLVDIDTTTSTTDFSASPAAELSGVELLVTAWGCPPITPTDLARMPRLKAIVHAAGTVKFVDREAWLRGIAVSSGAWANALPVAEYTLGMILLAGKDVFAASRLYTTERRKIDREAELPRTGNYRRTVGIVAASRIGCRVMELLRPFDFEVLLYDPYCSAERAAELGARSVGLDELAQRSTVLSIHAPRLTETVGMISRDVLAQLPDGATVINTARGDLVDQDALIDELRSGRLSAILDVTEPDVLPEEHVLYSAPNVVLTPHLAGAAGNELRRLGSSALAEVRRLVAGEPFRTGVSLLELERMA